MQAFNDCVVGSFNGNLVPLKNASCAVYNHGTTTLATIYSDDGITLLANPTLSSNTGQLFFYAADGHYDVVVTLTGYTPVTIADVLLEDPANANSYVITGGTINSTPIGATTPSTGAFTTLSSSGAIKSTNSSVTASSSDSVSQATLGADNSGNCTVSAYRATGASLNFYATTAGGTLTKYATLDASGNLGIGVTPSAWTGGKALQLSSTTSLFNDSTDTYFGNNFYYSTGWKYLTTAAAMQYQQGAGGHKWFTAPSGTAGNAITFTQAMTLDASGNLGLGVTPSAWSGYKALESTGGSVNTSGTGNIALMQNAYNDGAWKYKASLQASSYTQSAGVHYWYTAPSGTAGNAITFTQSLAVGKGTSLALEGATSAAGTGIAFPATQLASSDANTLDDYEEGSWTPSLGGTATYTANTGRYVKVGRQVTVSGTITVNAIGTGSTTVISGLPFTAGSDGYTYGGAISYYTSSASAVASITAAIGAGTSTMTLYSTTAMATAVTTNPVFGNATRVDFTATYNV